MTQTQNGLCTRCARNTYGILALIGAAIGVHVASDQVSVPAIVLLVLAAGLVFLTYRSTRETFRPLDQLDFIAREVAAGRFDARVTGIGSDDEIGRLCWHINDMLDQIEPFFREVGTSFKAVSDGRYYRKTLPSGLHGTLKSSLENINVSLDAMAKANHLQMRNMLSRWCRRSTPNRC